MKDEKHLAIVLNTTGFTQYKELTEATLKYAPYIVEMSTVVLPQRDVVNYRKPILPDGTTVSNGAFKFHGIDGREGDSRAETLHYLANAVQCYDGLVCHGGSFVVDTLKGEFIREGYEKAEQALKTIPVYDTMLVHSNNGEQNYPKLEELYKLFTGNEAPDNASSTEGRMHMLLEVWEYGQSNGAGLVIERREGSKGEE